VSRQGAAPGVPWGRWVADEQHMPHDTPAEAPYLPKLTVLQLSDEPALENPATFTRLVNWTQAAKANAAYKDTIVLTDLLGISDTTMANYISQARPDMVLFDVYPYKSVYVPPAQPGGTGSAGAPLGGPPTGWYGELRRFRAHTSGNDTRFGIYRQTFHAVQDYDTTVYRDPSPSELGVNTFGAMAFNAKMLADFVFNGGASSLFQGGAMATPSPLYTRMQQVNKTAQAMGRSLVHLTPLNDTQNGAVATTDVMFIRGQHKDANGVTQFNPVPVGFQPNGNNPNSFITQWTAYSTAVAQGNPDLAEDPWLTGFQAKNLGTLNDGLKGDAIISWFKPIGVTKGEARAEKEIYFMVVNGLSDVGGTAADCLQYINLDFTAPPATSIEYVDPATGDIKTLSQTNDPVPATAPGGTYLLTPVSGKLRLSLFLDGGDAFLFKFDNGEPFAGVPEPAAGAALPLAALLFRRTTRAR
jgi:hypothetical protein